MSDTRKKILEATWRLMEQSPGQVISMGEVARVVGISRQAVYLHFRSRTELILATSDYVDEIKGLDARLSQLRSATNGTEFLENSVEIWGRYIPEVYGLAKAMLMTRETDEAVAIVWNRNMDCLRGICQELIEVLQKEARLVPIWKPQEAVELLWTLLSINNWEQLTRECGWTVEQYIERMQQLLKQSFIVNDHHNTKA